MGNDDKSADDLVEKIQIIALFIGMGNGHVSEEELEYLDQEAPGYIRYCLEGRRAFEAFSDGKSGEEISSLVPKSITHTPSFGTIFGGAPAWAEEALNARRESGDITKYEAQFAAALTDPWDQIIAHYFALKILTFSGAPDLGELKAYLIMVAGLAGGDIDEELVEGLCATARDLLPQLLGLDPIDFDPLEVDYANAFTHEGDPEASHDPPAIFTALDGGIDSFRIEWENMSNQDPNLDFGGISLLESSIRVGDNEIAKFLLENGADPNLYSADGTTALVSAIATGNLEALELCLGAGANPELPSLHDALSVQGEPTKRKVVPLSHAAQYDFSDAIVALVKAGASVDQRMNNGHTALMTAAMAGNLAATTALLDAGANPDWDPPEDITLANWTPSTPLTCAAREGEGEIAALFLKRGVRVNVADGRGNTALKFFSKAGDDDIVAMLLDAGADPSLADREGWGSLMSACYEGHPSTVKILLEAGADANAKDSDGLSCLDLVQEAAENAEGQERKDDFAQIANLLQRHIV